MRPSPHLWFFTFKTATLAPELQVTMGPSLHLWFLHPKLRLYDLKYKSLLVPHLTHVFCIQNCDFSPRVASHYGSQPSSVVMCTHNSGIITRINSLYESHTSPMFFCIQNSAFSTRIANLNGSQPSSVVFPGKTAPFASELQVSMGPRPHLSFCACKTA